MQLKRNTIKIMAYLKKRPLIMRKEIFLLVLPILFFLTLMPLRFASATINCNTCTFNYTCAGAVASSKNCDPTARSVCASCVVASCGNCGANYCKDGIERRQRGCTAGDYHAGCYNDLIESCTTKVSVDSDGGNVPATAGTCTDYTGCTSYTSCDLYTSYADVCGSGTSLTEYYNSGASYASAAYTCSSYEVAATDTYGNDPTYTEACTAGTGAGCASGAFSTTAGSGGTDYCAGTCGTGTNSCYFVEYYPADSADSCTGLDTCTSTTYDADTETNTCNQCKGAGYWALGGEVAAAACCGDDSGEYSRVETAGTDAPSPYGGDTATTCCDVSTDCAEATGAACTASAGVAGTIPNKAYCNAGTWLGGDYNSGVCTAIGGSWAIGGEVAPAACCGDDSGENGRAFTEYAGNAHGVIDWGASQDACCDAADQIDYNGTCVTSGTGGNAVNTGYTGHDKYAYPLTSGWLDLDGHSTWPAAYGANVCTGGWMNMSSGDSTGERCGTAGGDACDEDANYGCCGDDSGENGQSRLCTSGCTTSSSDKSCCDVATDCVYGSTCYSTGWTGIAPWNASVNGTCTSGSWSQLSSCIYISGNWVIQCSDACNLSTAKDLGGNNITFNGAGTVTITANITNWTRATVQGGCHVISSSGGGLKN